MDADEDLEGGQDSITEELSRLSADVSDAREVLATTDARVTALSVRVSAVEKDASDVRTKLAGVEIYLAAQNSEILRLRTENFELVRERKMGVDGRAGIGAETGMDGGGVLG